MTTAPKLFTVQEAAAHVSVSVETFKTFIAREEIRVVDVKAQATTGTRARVRIREDDLAAWIDSRTTPRQVDR